jgi:hypothetical protein
MKILVSKILFGTMLLSVVAPAQTSTARRAGSLSTPAPTPTPPQKRGDRTAPGASPASSSSLPASPAAIPTSSSVAISNTPQHAPDLLDFGTVSEGSSAKRTFSLITNAAGYVTVNIPPGPFRLAEFREMGPATGSKNLGAQPAMPAVPGARSRMKYQEGQNGPYQWSMAPNTEMQIDIVFTPRPPSGPGTAASQLTTLNATGPGAHGNWALVIPLRGTLNPVKLTPESPQPKAFGNNNLPMSGKGGSSPGTAAPPTARKMSSSEALQRMRSAGRPVLVATVRNSKLSQSGIDAKTLAQLKQQKQAADQERAWIIATKQRGGSQTTKSIGTGGAAGVGVSNASASGVGTGNNTLQSPSAPVPNVLICAKAAPDALISSINGQKKASVIFTTDPDNNLFTFTGCNFGDTQGSIHLYGGFAHGNVPFEISFWNDKSIVARVQPDLAGELDRDGVTLVLVSGNGHQTAFQGFKFYAARQTYVLASIPNPSSKIIFGPPDLSKCQVAKNWTFWACGVGPDPDDGLTVAVVRAGVQGDKGTDQFTISGLKPGFEVSDVSLWISPYVTDKQGWSMVSFAENISVSYVFDWKNAEATYGLRISATGPRGLDSVWK